MNTIIGNAKDETLILLPDFSKMNNWEDLRDVISLFNLEIAVKPSETSTEWLEKISNLQRRSLLKITTDAEHIYVSEGNPVPTSNYGNDSVEQ